MCRFEWSKPKEQSDLGLYVSIFLRLKYGVFSFQNNPKNLDPSGSRSSGLFRKGKT